MSGISIRCPETGTDVDTGFDQGSIEALADVHLTLEDCPECGEAHAWSAADARPGAAPAGGLSGAESPSSVRSLP